MNDTQAHPVIKDIVDGEDHRLAPQFGVIELLYRGIKSIHIHMDYFSDGERIGHKQI